ncbi:hypothetical protein ACFL59_15535 [Planctomycetota bacterium]
MGRVLMVVLFSAVVMLPAYAQDEAVVEPRPEEEAKRVFALVDADKDGRIVPKEVKAIQEALMAELVKAEGEAAEELVSKKYSSALDLDTFALYDMDDDRVLVEKELVSALSKLDLRLSDKDMTWLAEEEWAEFAALADANKDGVVTADEAGPEIVADMDTDGDGKVTKEEFVANRAKMYRELNADMDKAMGDMAEEMKKMEEEAKQAEEEMKKMDAEMKKMEEEAKKAEEEAKKAKD